MSYVAATLFVLALGTALADLTGVVAGAAALVEPMFWTLLALSTVAWVFAAPRPTMAEARAPRS